MIHFIYAWELGFYHFENYTLTGVQRRVPTTLQKLQCIYTRWSSVGLDWRKTSGWFFPSLSWRRELPSSPSSVTTEGKSLRHSQFERQRLETRAGPDTVWKRVRGNTSELCSIVTSWEARLKSPGINSYCKQKAAAAMKSLVPKQHESRLVST